LWVTRSAIAGGGRTAARPTPPPKGSLLDTSLPARSDYSGRPEVNRQVRCRSRTFGPPTVQMTPLSGFGGSVRISTLPSVCCRPQKGPRCVTTAKPMGLRMAPGFSTR
jgi:hypothetical protein